MLQRGEQVPHFAVTTVDGRPVAYRDIWQRQNLLLVTVAAGEPADAGSYASAIASHAGDVASHEAALVITREPVPGIPAPAIVVADRWGEIQTIIPRPAGGGPAPADVLEWTAYVQRRCPECEGEAR